MLMQTDQYEMQARARYGRSSPGHGASRLSIASSAAAVRILDVSMAFTLILMLLPLFVTISFAIFLSDGGKPIFAHRRVGRHGNYFACLKFRSMVKDSERRLADLLASDNEARMEWARDQKLKKDPRITNFGRFLRKSSIDELPQLINVLRGEMSIVGPRPIVQDEVIRYRRFFADYAAVKPGLTGLWQVNGRNKTSYRRRVALDVTYARSKSVKFDLYIIAKTVPAVLFARGSY